MFMLLVGNAMSECATSCAPLWLHFNHPGKTRVVAAGTPRGAVSERQGPFLGWSDRAQPVEAPSDLQDIRTKLRALMARGHLLGRGTANS